MNTIETIQEKIHQLPLAAQKEVLEAVNQIEQRYRIKENSGQQSMEEIVHPLTLIAQIQIDGPSDLAERHDFYAHGKLED